MQHRALPLPALGALAAGTVGALAAWSAAPGVSLGIAFASAALAVVLTRRAHQAHWTDHLAALDEALARPKASAPRTPDGLVTAVEQLAHQRKVLAEQLDLLPLPVVEIDRDYRMTYVNQAAAQAIGQSPADAVGKHCYSFFNTGHCQTEACALRQAMARRTVVTAETAANLPTAKKPMPIRYTGIPIYGDQGEVRGALEAVVNMSGVYDALVDDLQAMSVTLDDSVRELEGTADAMSAQASSVLTRAGDATQQVNLVSDRLQAVAAEAQGVESQMSSVAAAVEEMGASLNEIASHTARSAQVAQAVDARAQAAAETMDALDQSTRAISQVLSLISDIADQTNLLALNATIEAASAGPAGAGFAVVAQEVKTLARETARATEQIEAQLQRMQASAGEAVRSVRDIAGSVDEMRDITQSVAAAVEEQSAAVREISGHVQGTARAYGNILRDVGQSAEATVHVANDVEQVQGDVQRTAGGVQDTQRGLHALATLTEHLRRTAARFAVTK
jgi:methyl-accepting chemotaxis protein/PAS domain-containing protein